MKITVIATGFGPFIGRSPPSAVQTPVDMSPYAEAARVRAEPAAASGGHN